MLAVHGETPVHYNEVKKKKKSIHILYASTNSRKCKQIYSDMTEGLNWIYSDRKQINGFLKMGVEGVRDRLQKATEELLGTMKIFA